MKTSRTTKQTIVSPALPIAQTVAAQTPPASGQAANVFVSPQGKDRWSGRLASPDGDDGPLATIGRAQQAVREIRKTDPQTAVRVIICGGTYYLDSTLEFGPEDSGTQDAPVVYTAAPGEKVTISRGRRLEGGKWGEVNNRRAWVVDVPDVKEGRWNFRQLFVNDDRRPRTRLPRGGFYKIKAVPEHDASQGGVDINGDRGFIYAGTWNPDNRNCSYNHNIYWNVSGEPLLFGDKSWAEWKAAGQDNDSLIADPLFVHPERGDFRLKPGSPAAKIRFEPRDISKAGPVKDSDNVP
jgi:hypothetical protein